MMVDQDTRYWDRVGMYVTKEFAYEWMDKIKETGAALGKYYDDDIEDYVEGSSPTPRSLTREIEDLFEGEYVAKEVQSDIQNIIKLTEMERNKVSRIKELMAEYQEGGLSKEEARDKAKEDFDNEIQTAVAEALGIDPEKSMFELPDNWDEIQAEREARDRAEGIKKAAQEAFETKGYSNMSVKQLKDELNERGLTVSGKKAALLERLLEDEQLAAEAEADATSITEEVANDHTEEE